MSWIEAKLILETKLLLIAFGSTESYVIAQPVIYLTA